MKGCEITLCAMIDCFQAESASTLFCESNRYTGICRDSKTKKKKKGHKTAKGPRTNTQRSEG